MRSPLARIFLNINNAYTLFITSWHMGLMVSIVIFWYPSWKGLTIDTIQNNFSIPAIIATRVFIILIPIAMLTTAIMIITEWKTPLRWPAIIVLCGIIGSTMMAKYFIFPLNDIIYAGVKSQEELTPLLLKWMRLNNWRVFFSVMTWLGMLTFYTLKINRRGG